MNRFLKEFNPEQTDIVLCGSMSQSKQWIPVIHRLRKMGYRVSVPDLIEQTDQKTMSDAQAIAQKGWLVRRHIANIMNAKVVLIANYDKGTVKNYVGANSFLEMTTGFVYEKPVYLLNPVPFQDNREELLAMAPIVLNGDLSKIAL